MVLTFWNNQLAAQPVFTVIANTNGKSSHQVNAKRMVSSSIVQVCDQPVTTTGSLIIYDQLSGSPIRGRITSLTLFGTNATLFRVVTPFTTVASVSFAGVPITVEFNSNTIGTYSAQLSIATSDSTGQPLQDTLVVTYTARRGKKEFQAVQQIFDFGSVPPNTTATKTFEYLRNTGTEPLEWQISSKPSPYFTILNTIPAPRIQQVSTTQTVFLVTQAPGTTLSLVLRFEGAPMGNTIIDPLPAADNNCGTSQDIRLRVVTQPVSVQELTQPVQSLTQYPNPFTTQTTLEYDLPTPQHIRLAVFSPLGQMLMVLADEWQQAGRHSVSADMSSFASGVYVARLQAGATAQTALLRLVR